jgi:hypothetical protein
MNMEDGIMFALGAFAGYYFVTHMRKTGKAY